MSILKDYQRIQAKHYNIQKSLKENEINIQTLGDDMINFIKKYGDPLKIDKDIEFNRILRDEEAMQNKINSFSDFLYDFNERFRVISNSCTERPGHQERSLRNIFRR